MNDICSVCGAGDYCPCCREDGEYNQEQCDEILSMYVEKCRTDYNKSWQEYIKTFKD